MDSRLKSIMENESEETVMDKVMNDEIAEAIAMLEKANSALSRIFNTEEGEGDE